MKSRIAVLFLILVTVLAAQPEEDRRHEYVAFYAATSATSNILTVQQPASGSRAVSFKVAYVECTVACTATLKRDGTAASTTEITPSKLNTVNSRGDTIPVASADAFRSSNVGAGTAISPAYQIPANGWKNIPLVGKVLEGNGNTKNFTVDVASSSSGTLTIIVKWEEY